MLNILSNICKKQYTQKIRQGNIDREPSHKINTGFFTIFSNLTFNATTRKLIQKTQNKTEK